LKTTAIAGTGRRIAGRAIVTLALDRREHGVSGHAV
jgi:hypothetical protein